jgi:pimeloyl-ACP methyl ester carboxylesterase
VTKVSELHRSEYCVLNGRTDARLSDVERLTVIGGEGLHRLVTRLGRSLQSVSLESLAPNLTLDTLLGSHERLLLLRREGVIGELFCEQPPAFEPHVTPIHGFPDGEVKDLHFQSVFPKKTVECDRSYASDAPENQVLHVRFWEHHERRAQRPTIVAVHGWTMGDQRVNSLAFVPGLFFTLGCNVALVELPFHGRRAPQRDNNLTPLFPSADAVRTCTAMAHAVHDLRTLATYLRGRGSESISCVGLSLGAYVAALWASLDRLDRLALLVPLVSMGDMAWRLLKDSQTQYHGAAAGVTKAFLRDLFSDHSPLGRHPKTPQNAILVVGGRGDHLVPREQITLLRERWSSATVMWAQGGHSAPAQRGGAFEKVKSFLTQVR